MDKGLELAEHNDLEEEVYDAIREEARGTEVTIRQELHAIVSDSGGVYNFEYEVWDRLEDFCEEHLSKGKEYVKSMADTMNHEASLVLPDAPKVHVKTFKLEV